MSMFEKQAEKAQELVSEAAEWMQDRNVGPRHFWRWPVFTKANKDPDNNCPVYDDETAQIVFGELVRRNLMVPFQDSAGKPLRVDASDEPAYYMRYDIEGWDKAVSDARPWYGRWRKFRRNLFMNCVMFVLGAIVVFGYDYGKDMLKEALKGDGAKGKQAEKK